MTENPEFYMRHALAFAELALQENEVPVGAVIVRRSTGEIIGKGYNRRENTRHALAHAELIAIDEACKTLGGWRLPDCALYVTLEPCPMCAGAIIQARIDEVYFGALDNKSGAVISIERMFSLPYNYRPKIYNGILEQECSAILSDFFRDLRARRKKQALARKAK
ncbi:MAG: tRNA adenosine(34) deaminase TadA [Oscillospiraceae bacterium]|nr:tRNA adenosine(34) deaminase TadA [Oscillospiraceae bacterium]MDE6005162.1 tRNA adenosine(34) deaminase TadA [Oscillospiraceae bacterium]